MIVWPLVHCSSRACEASMNKSQFQYIDCGTSGAAGFTKPSNYPSLLAKLETTQ